VDRQRRAHVLGELLPEGGAAGDVGEEEGKHGVVGVL
jgi:hypothetical protein